MKKPFLGRSFEQETKLELNILERIMKAKMSTNRHVMNLSKINFNENKSFSITLF